MMSLPIKAALLGAGRRGFHIYGKYAEKYKKKLRFVAIAEPIEKRREKFARLHKITADRCFESWEDLLSEKKLCDVLFICTQDQMHTEPTLLALDRGYHVLLEKPMAHRLSDCIKIVQKSEETGKILGLSHVLRYTSFFSSIFNMIKNGLLGDIVNISQRENISWYHMAHSFVRGPWANIEESSPMILAKACHDMDLLHWMVGSLPKKISSFGNLLHFRTENAPRGAPKYCLDGCPARNTCNYYAPRIYIDIIPIIQIMQKGGNRLYKFIGNFRKKHLRLLNLLAKIIPQFKRLRYWSEWPVYYLYKDEEEDYSDEAKIQILKTSPYGRCVYYCNNNVVDHQVVNIEFENAVTANFTMHGFSEKEGRTLRIDGTKATIIGEFHDAYKKLTLYNHYSGEKKVILNQKLSFRTVEHGGGDVKLIDAFLQSIINPNIEQPLTNARECLESHLMAFAANESRIKGTVIDMDDYRKKSEHL
ncbi:MAG: Gfo/Idh/MocA family oxidoreductase [Promethearchaeota archaeon]|nr:MAG: Gfo/Idh/MocA family oxidoreductase [Candidatus Lokiarchaeota archaeon]